MMFLLFSLGIALQCYCIHEHYTNPLGVDGGRHAAVLIFCIVFGHSQRHYGRRRSR